MDAQKIVNIVLADPSNVTPTPFMESSEIINSAKKAIANGATRVCLGAAWRSVRDSLQFDRVLEVVKEITGMGVDSLLSALGMLNESPSRTPERSWALCL